MKKIINSKKYDTDTATKIAEYRFKDEEFEHRETLYQKKTGEFFLEDYECYTDADDREYDSLTHQLYPMCVEEAKCFVEENGTVEMYESLWGEVDE